MPDRGYRFNLDDVAAANANWSPSASAPQVDAILAVAERLERIAEILDARLQRIAEVGEHP